MMMMMISVKADIYPLMFWISFSITCFHFSFSPVALGLVFMACLMPNDFTMAHPDTYKKQLVSVNDISARCFVRISWIALFAFDRTDLVYLSCLIFGIGCPSSMVVPFAISYCLSISSFMRIISSMLSIIA